MQLGEDAANERYKESPAMCRCPARRSRLSFDENLHGASSNTAIDSNRDDRELVKQLTNLTMRDECAFSGS